VVKKHYRKAYRRKDGTWVRATWVRSPNPKQALARPAARQEPDPHATADSPREPPQSDSDPEPLLATVEVVEQPVLERQHAHSVHVAGALDAPEVPSPPLGFGTRAYFPVALLALQLELVRQAATLVIVELVRAVVLAEQLRRQAVLHARLLTRAILSEGGGLFFAGIFFFGTSCSRTS
jgi:hypothetical protein